eukprot:TRINITY_DN2058_c0_g1_i2.p1 TRINITY_DN2058_c0_g1~~TRINITY_DN2058_c0_g1_i2.p1  ORF type:complete len:343 (+),score=57.60 TRINITY_DN2058_c0_g1_i2:106-1134(+)
MKEPMKPLRQTTCWPATEVSLARNSFNSIVDRKRMDVTEVMLRHGSMGRQAEMGPDWCPTGLLSRQLAEMLSAKQDEQLPKRQMQKQAEEAAARALAEADVELQVSDLPQGLCRHPDLEQPQPPLVSPSRLESPSDKMMAHCSSHGHRRSPEGNITPRPRAMPAWGMSIASRSPTPAGLAGPTRSPTPAALKPAPPAEAEPAGHTSAGAEVGAGGAAPQTTTQTPPPTEVPRLAMKKLGLGSTMLGLTGPSSSRGSYRPCSTGEPLPGSLTARSTFCWRPGEQSLNRNSFNCIVNQKKLDVTEVMIRDASMGRQAELGPEWCPGGMASRRMAMAMMAKRIGC